MFPRLISFAVSAFCVALPQTAFSDTSGADGSSDPAIPACHVVMVHSCKITPDGSTKTPWLDTVIGRNHPVIAFTDCGWEGSSVVRLGHSEITRDEDSQNIPQAAMLELEVRMRDFRRRAIDAHPICTKEMRTQASLFEYIDEADDYVGFVSSLQNTTLRDAYFID